MNGPTITLVFVIAWIVSAIAWDVFASWTWGKEATISQVLGTRAQANPIIPFILGLIFGHIFWSQK